jgi:Spy/CpxP family protein refolding chaperone
MRKITLLALLLAFCPLAVLAADGHGQTPPRGERPRLEAAQERRAELERQVHRQFVARAAERLALDAAQRDRLHEVLTAGAEARRTMAQESRQLRMQLMQAVRADDTPVATYQRLLERAVELRDREQLLARREDAALAEFLDPRQRAMFLVMRMQMSEQVRGMRGGRPGGPGARPGPPGG